MKNNILEMVLGGKRKENPNTVKDTGSSRIYKGKKSAFIIKKKPITESSEAVSKKISYLVHKEKKPVKQAVAMAINMNKEHRLTSNGQYIHVKGKNK